MDIPLLRRNLEILLGLLFVLVLSYPTIVMAQDEIRRLADDFRPILAEAQEVQKGVFELDRGASSGIRHGDLFALVDKGGPIYLPGTKRVLGYEDKVVGKCKVQEVEDKSARCTLYFSAAKPKKRLKAIRFVKMKAALFIDGKLVSPVISTYSLKKMLPNLEWLEPTSGPLPVPTKSSMEAFGIDMVFELEDDSLHVYGPSMEELARYQILSGLPVPLAGKTAGSASVSSGIGPGPVTFDFSNAELIGRLRGKVLQVAVSDLDGDGQKEIIYLMEKELGIAPFRRNGRADFYGFEDFECPCSFSSYNGWIVLNISIEGAGLASKLFRYENGRLHLIQDDINLWLSFARTDCKRSEPVLMGQEYEKERFRGKRIFLLGPTKDGIEYLEEADFPNDFSIQSSVAMDINGTCTLFYVSFDGFFKAFAAGTHMWTSLFPVVGERPCCGPVHADLLQVGRGILFDGLIPENRGRGKSGLYYFSVSDGYAFSRADSNLRGQLCGVSKTEQGIIIGVTDKTKDGWNTYLYQFPAP